MKIIKQPGRVNGDVYSSNRLTNGCVYVVVGISIGVDRHGKNTVSFDVRDDDGFLSSINLDDCLIVDGRPFSEWILGNGNEKAFVCWPADFFNPDWMERLLDFDSGAVKMFNDIADRAIAESNV